MMEHMSGIALGITSSCSMTPDSVARSKLDSEDSLLPSCTSSSLPICTVFSPACRRDSSVEGPGPVSNKGFTNGCGIAGLLPTALLLVQLVVLYNRDFTMIFYL